MEKPHFGFSINKTDNIMELFSECFVYGKFRKVGTLLRTDYSYEKYIVDSVPLMG